jgi:hypothetical protein
MLILYVYMNLLASSLMVPSALNVNLIHGHMTEQLEDMKQTTEPGLWSRVVMHKQRADLRAAEKRET